MNNTKPRKDQTMNIIKTVPSLTLPLWERVKYGTVNKEELIEALQRIEELEKDLDDAQCEAASQEEDKEIAEAQLEEARDKLAKFDEKFDTLRDRNEKLQACVDYIRYHCEATLDPDDCWID